MGERRIHLLVSKPSPWIEIIRSNRDGQARRTRIHNNPPFYSDFWNKEKIEDRINSTTRILSFVADIIITFTSPTNRTLRARSFVLPSPPSFDKPRINRETLSRTCEKPTTIRANVQMSPKWPEQRGGKRQRKRASSKWFEAREQRRGGEARGEHKAQTSF